MNLRGEFCAMIRAIMKTTILFALLLFPFTLTHAQAVAAPAGEVIGVGNFLHVVADAERALTFYHDVLGMDLPPVPANAPPVVPRPYLTVVEIQDLYDAPGTPYRVTQAMIAESPMRDENVEWNVEGRKPIRPRLQDPGAGVMAMQVRDLDAIMARVKQAKAIVVSSGGEPVAITGPEGKSRHVMLQDPDGFFVELIQPETLPASSAQASNNIYNIGFAVTVDNMDRMLAVFKAMGFEPVLGEWTKDKALARVAGVGAGASIRRATALVPGTSFEVAMTEFKGLDKKHLQSRVRDPGTSMLRLRVRDMDSILARVKAAGLTVASKGGQPVTVMGANGGQHIAIINGPDNLKIQFVQAIPKPN
jgi:catechol 2,3-dioxygenase-like lactoylglutathione lyase family enzyme